MVADFLASHLFKCKNSPGKKESSNIAAFGTGLNFRTASGPSPFIFLQSHFRPVGVLPKFYLFVYTYHMGIFVFSCYSLWQTPLPAASCSSFGSSSDCIPSFQCPTLCGDFSLDSPRSHTSLHIVSSASAFLRYRLCFYLQHWRLCDAGRSVLLSSSHQVVRFLPISHFKTLQA